MGRGQWGKMINRKDLGMEEGRELGISTGREAWAWFKANGRAHGVLFWGTSLLGGGRAGPAPECGSLMPRSRTRSVRVLVKKRSGNVTKMTPGGVTHMSKLDSLTRPSTWPVSYRHIRREFMQMKESRSAGVGCCRSHVNCCRDFLLSKKAVTRAFAPRE